jgi:hypothetical protein
MASEEEHIHAIGAFIYGFSQLDFTLRAKCMSAFGPLGVIDEMMLMFEHVDTLKILSGYMRVRERRGMKDEHQKVWNDLYKRYHEVNTKRVRIVHGIWSPSDEGLALLRGSSSQKVAKEHWHFEDAGELDELTAACNELMGRFLSAP